MCIKNSVQKTNSVQHAGCIKNGNFKTHKHEAGKISYNKPTNGTLWSFTREGISHSHHPLRSSHTALFLLPRCQRRSPGLWAGSYPRPSFGLLSTSNRILLCRGALLLCIVLSSTCHFIILSAYGLFLPWECNLHVVGTCRFYLIVCP